MSAVDIFLHVGAGAGWGVLGAASIHMLRKRAFRADYRRADRIARHPIHKAMSGDPEIIGSDRLSFPARCAQVAAEMDIADLALIQRFNYLPGHKELAASRHDEIEAWRAKRRRQPLMRLAAFVRSAAVG